MSFNLLRGRTWMLFVDGENFTKAGQRALKAAEVEPKRGATWRRDVFLWGPGRDPHWEYVIEPQQAKPVQSRSIFVGGHEPAADLRRAYWYTADTADEPEWTETRLAIRELGFEPRLFKRRQGRTKAVDVALASDVLALGATGQYQAAVIVAGDGDYVPLVEAAKRLGLHVGIAFVSEDLSPELRIAADEYVDLTQHLVEAWQRHLKPEEPT